MSLEPSRHLRQVVLDTETTGLEVAQNHRVIEIGAVEIINRRLTGRHYHQYIQPDRAIDAGALEVHGITEDFLADKPRFSEIADAFLDFIEGAEAVIHNAAFDVSFLDYELRLCAANTRMNICCVEVTDSLELARRQYPGQRNSLDALCKRLGIDNSRRTLHGALLDSEILAEVYLAMTGGQSALVFESEAATSDAVNTVKIDPSTYPNTPVIRPNAEELAAHQKWLEKLQASPGGCVWQKLASAT